MFDMQMVNGYIVFQLLASSLLVNLARFTCNGVGYVQVGCLFCYFCINFSVFSAGFLSSDQARSASNGVFIGVLIVGIGIGILQAAAQVQEMTISFVPKLFLVTLILFYFGPSLGAKFEVFVQSLFAKIILVGLS